MDVQIPCKKRIRIDRLRKDFTLGVLGDLLVCLFGGAWHLWVSLVVFLCPVVRLAVLPGVALGHIR